MELPNYIRVFALPSPGDLIKLQYFGDSVEIRANMTGLTGTGRLLAVGDLVEAENRGEFNYTNKARRSVMQKLYLYFLRIGLPQNERQYYEVVRKEYGGVPE